MVQKNRVQEVSVKQNPFQKRLGLLGYALTVASGSQGRNFEIRDLEQNVALSYFDWVSPAATLDNGFESKTEVQTAASSSDNGSSQE